MERWKVGGCSDDRIDDTVGLTGFDGITVLTDLPSLPLAG